MDEDKVGCSMAGSSKAVSYLARKRKVGGLVRPRFTLGPYLSKNFWTANLRLQCVTFEISPNNRTRVWLRMGRRLMCLSWKLTTIQERPWND